MGWSGGLLEWSENGRSYLSVVFSWKKQDAFQRAVWLGANGNDVFIGGPAAYADPGFFDGVAKVAPPIDDVVYRHNKKATFTTRGCIRDCPFCIVPKAEPEYLELAEWPVRPIVCDNNLLASSDRHFDTVIDKLKPLQGIDFNQGLDARLMTKHHADRLAELDMRFVRLAWDWIGIEKQWMSAFETLRSAGFPKSKIKTYVLIGFNDTPDDALYRLEAVKSLGVDPFPMRYQPLDSVKRNQYVAPAWSESQLRDFTRYWSKLRFLRKVPFSEYKR